MFIKYDLTELVEFFEVEPTWLYEEEAGVFMFSVKNGEGFSFLFHVDAYAKRVHTEITCGTDIVFSGQFSGVKNIRKGEQILLVDLSDERRLIIQKGVCPGVIIEGTV